MKIDARDWKFEVSEDPTAGTPVWAAIAGIESFDLNASANEASVETTDFDSAGIHESQAMQRGATLALSGKRVVDAANAHDPGQLSCENLAALVGEASLGGIRFRHVNDTNWTEWDTAWASLSSNGGGNNDKTSWGCTFTRSGPATSVAVV